MSSKRILKLNRNKRYILTLVLIVTLVCAAGCGQGVGSSTTTFEATSSTTTSTLPVISTIPGHSITVLDAKKLLDSGSKTTVFIDIRNQTDYDQNHVPGAVLITAVELPSRLSEVPHDKQVIVYAGCLWATEANGTRAVQMLLDNGYSNVFEMTGGFDAWTKAGYPIETSIVYPAGLFAEVTGPFSLVPDETGGTSIPYGSVITHWRNGITEVTGLDNKRILVAMDSDAATVTLDTGEIRRVTFMYQLPQGTTAIPNSEPGVTKMMLDGNVILTIVSKGENFTP